MGEAAIEFRISQRHYDIILKQAVDNYPQEAGGFLGGKDHLIQAVFPVFNQVTADKTGEFGVTSDDIIRAHEFFKKHGLDYYGVYHTHPDAEAYPSKQDISIGQKYHFIVGLMDVNRPIFKAFEIRQMRPYAVPLVILADQQFSVLDIQSGASAAPQETVDEKIKRAAQYDTVKRDPASEASLLHSLIENIRDEKVKYPKMPPQKRSSDFSTLA
jgi:proteasome lid subunit RPN8/RPN11